MPPDAEAEWTVGRLLEWTRGFFEKKGIPQPRLEAEILLAHVLGIERIDLYMKYDQAVAEEPRGRFRDLVRRRAEREPTQYLVGTCDFMSLAFEVTSDVLIPRPETELLVEEVLRRVGVKGRPRPGAAKPASAVPSAPAGPAVTAGSAEAAEGTPAARPLRIIDLCTGSGCVAVSLAVYLPAARVVATDLSAAALAVARRNAEAHGAADRVTLLEGDLYDALDAADAEPADYLVANPPYVAEGEWTGLQPEIRDHEPRVALVAGPRGTEMVERVVRGAPAYLRTGGTLLVEIGAGQGAAVLAAAGAVRGLAGAEILKDYAGLERILMARRAEKQ